ncbi:hypothetical protein MTR67_045706 [Solanum verrucosum]|uniref:Uncharacterized protein n=1 Tax=Solanum verrucosum TaxID=315347 RepID=A0AAF0ZUV7_SOLVR|nr:uncharacterized protein LOC125806788 [Solanum verrucosum]WMV52321.1 hypothetical protein MTR67_045706 [Solanum verrucosum]
MQINNIEKKMEKEDGLRTVECLRGRLIAERAASKKAKEDAELMGNKLIELETKLKEESKSRNKAEKKLKYFIKKLESMNICYISDESEHSSLFDKSEISSVTSTTTTSNSSKIISEQNSQFKDSMISDFQDSQELISQENSINFDKNSKDDDNNSKELEFSNSDANSSKSLVHEEWENGEDESYFQGDNVNNSLALVPLDLPKPKSIDPIVLDATVREVLDALRHAKEKLQTQMERGRGMIKVG